MAAPSALSTTYPDLAGVQDILGEAGVNFRLDDNQSGAVKSAELARLTRLYSAVTDRVNFYLAKYVADDLADNWLVYDWSCIICAYRLCKRRNQPVTGSLQDLYDETIRMLESIQAGETVLPNVPMIASPSLSLSNVRLDGRYHTRQLRVQRTISDSTPARHKQAVDIVPEVVPEPFPN